jgi:dihydroneopterin aldolase
MDRTAPYEVYEINLENLELYGYHGVLAEEKRLGQRFRIDLNLCVKSKEERFSDSVEDILSYAEVAERVHTIFMQERYNLLETLADKILLDLSSYPEILEAEIKVTKTSPPIPLQLGSVGISLKRRYPEHTANR